MGDLPVYLSIDIDVLDPSYRARAPGRRRRAGSPAGNCCACCAALTDLNLVSADVVEVAPAYDHAEITAIAAATVVFDLITLMARESLGHATTARPR